MIDERLDAGLRVLLPDGHGWVHLGTVGRDAEPHVTPVLLCVRDGALLFSLTGKQKRRNLARDPRVCISVAREQDLAHVVVWGEMSQRVDADAVEVWRAMMRDALGESAFAFTDTLSDDGTALGTLAPTRWRAYGL